MTARRCADCRRVLRKSPGPLGPGCARKLAGLASPARTGVTGTRLAPGLSTALTRPPVTVSPGQAELPLAPMQPTLWSL